NVFLSFLCLFAAIDHYSRLTYSLLSWQRLRPPKPVFLPAWRPIAGQTFHRSRILRGLNRGAPGETRQRRETIGPDRARSIGSAAERGLAASASALVRAEPAVGGSGAGGRRSFGRQPPA